MNILCIETSASLCSVAVIKHESVFYCQDSKPMAHAEVLMVLINECAAKADIELNELNAVALSGGPGSYTGLRIGCSSAKGICYALNIPLIIIDTLKIAAFLAREKNSNYDYYWAMTDARRMEVYHSIFNKDLKPVTDTQSGIITDNGFIPVTVSGSRVLLCGDGAKKGAPLLQLDDAEVIPNAVGMCQLARAAFQQSEFVNVAYYEPFYLKQANITTSKPR